jgi:rod shape-determining protein MreD
LKKYLIFILLISAIVFYQSSPISNHLAIGGVSPDFILIAISLAAFILGPIPGQIIGFGVGLIVDIISGGLLGISAFTFSIIGYAVGLVGRKVYGNNILITITILFVVTLLKASVFSMLAAIFLKPGYFGYFSHGKIFLEAVLNSIAAPVLFVIITKIEGRVKR